MKTKRNRTSFLLCLLLICAIMQSGCGEVNHADSSGDVTYQIYYLNKDGTKLEAENYKTVVGTCEEKIDELLEQLSSPANGINEKNPISGDVVVNSYKYSNWMLSIDFATTYNDLDPITEVLTRAAIVRTLVQIEDVNYVLFRVNGEMLVDDTGSPIGTMTASTFIDNAGAEINSYETVKIVLFFANEDGTELIPTSRVVDFNTNISLERLVVEQWIAGPSMAEAYSVVKPSTKIISVTTIDGVCYVNLDESFLTQTYSASPEVVIYSLTNSLVELSKINKVQIMIEGETDIMFRDTVSLKTLFERNLDIIE